MEVYTISETRNKVGECPLQQIGFKAINDS